MHGMQEQALIKPITSPVKEKEEREKGSGRQSQFLEIKTVP